MGECNYYLKARFRTAKQAITAIPKLSDLLGQGELAARYWQDSRSGLRSGKLPKKKTLTSENFWTIFRERFPLVHHYLGELADSADWDNGLAGQLSCMVDPHSKRTHEPKSELFQKKNILFLKLSGIWHCAELERLESYCLKDLGALAAGSISEEDLESDDDDDEEASLDDQEYFDAIEI